MNHEIVFRIGLIAVLNLAALIQVYFGRKARPHQGAYTSIKREAFRRAGRLNLIVHIALIFGLAIIAVMYAAASASIRWSAVALPEAWRWVGLGLSFVGLVAPSKSTGSLAGSGPPIRNSRRITS